MTKPAGTAVIKVGYENFTPPVAPPGMYYHHDSGLILPQGVRLASRGQVIACYLLAVLLFAVTLGAGYLLWALATWGSGQTPAQRLLHLRCWRPDARRLAGRTRMALRQVINLLLDGEAFSGVFILIISQDLNSWGDFFTGTVVLSDPDEVLLSWAPATASAAAG
jgi:uncharacterized RDD family membrane protein YckC